MSTKTTIKRVALVAATALAIGGFSSVSPASAANFGTEATAIATTTASTYGAVGTASTTTFSLTGLVAGAAGRTTLVSATVAGPTGSTATPVFSETGNALLGATGVAGGSVDTITSTAAHATIPTAATVAGTVSFTPDMPGLYTVTLTSNAQTATFVVKAAGAAYSVGDGAPVAPAATGAGIAGPGNTAGVTVFGNASTNRVLVTVSGAGASIISGGTVATGNASTLIAASAATVAGTAILIATPQVGAVTVNAYYETGNLTGFYASTPSSTVTINVAAVGVTGVVSLATSTVYDTITIAGASTVAANMTSVLVSGAFSAATPVVAYKYSMLDANKSAATISATNKFSVVVSGPGVVSTSSSNQTDGAKALASSSGNTGNFYLYGDGSSGVSTITVYVGTTLVATKSVTFYSSTVASIAAKVITNYVASSGTATSDVIEVTAKDAQGNAIKGAVISAAADTTNLVATIDASATTDATGVATFAVTGKALKFGAAKFNFADATTLIKATATTNVSDVVASALTITPDVATASAGDKITYTLSATDANGLPLADAAYTFFAAKPVVSTSLGSNPLDSTTVTLVDGKATGVAYAPAAGKVVITWTLVGTLASGVASGPVGKALVGTTISTSVDIAGSADSALAVDAANAATDAANAAAEEASNATEAASEALAAVNSLATTVASLIAGIKSQLTALTALIKKIQAKVKA